MIWSIKTYIIAYVKIQKLRYTIQYVKSTSLLASLYNPIVNPAMVSTVRFYDMGYAEWDVLMLSVATGVIAPLYLWMP